MDGGPKVDGQRSLIGLGGRRQQSGDFEGSCKSSRKIETEEWFEDDDAEEESSDEEEEDEDGEDEDDKDMELFYFYECIGCTAMFREEGELLQHIATCDMI